MTVVPPPDVTVRRPPGGCAEEWRLDTPSGSLTARLYEADPGDVDARGRVVRRGHAAAVEVRTGPAGFGVDALDPAVVRAAARLLDTAARWLADQLDTAPPPAPAGEQQTTIFDHLEAAAS